VCAYDNVTSLINADELGPINKGCPYMPTRKKAEHQEANGVYKLIQFLHCRLFCEHWTMNI